MSFVDAYLSNVTCLSMNCILKVVSPLNDYKLLMNATVDGVYLSDLNSNVFNMCIHITRA
jgi:hypothetical protein